ncbi:hypothetical protein A2U01_0066786, partial [Trifolium medium]|nr:hypothetical protein [Trifolium medium]
LFLKSLKPPKSSGSPLAPPSLPFKDVAPALGGGSALATRTTPVQIVGRLLA